MRRVGVGARGLGVALALATACSSASSRPPLLGDCQANDAGCSTQIGVGGKGGDDSGSGASCDQMDLSGSSQCTQCAGQQCCSALTACFNDTECVNLYDCEEGCGGVASCVKAECGMYSGALATFNEVETCLIGKCAVCTESGVGDPCTSNANCAADRTCLDGWCTADCTATTASTACSGLGPGGTNALGFANACLAVAGTGEVCVPGCTATSDCASFLDTLCLPMTAVGGATVSVCSRIADASL